MNRWWIPPATVGTGVVVTTVGAALVSVTGAVILLGVALIAVGIGAAHQLGGGS